MVTNSHRNCTECSLISKVCPLLSIDFNEFNPFSDDFIVSDDLNDNFSKYVKEHSHELGINFQIYVLQAGAWPLNQSALSPFNIPLPLEKSVSTFEKFYASKFNGRKLTWLHHLCQAELKFGFTKKPYSVVMGTYHMAVLLLFESTDSLQYWEIQVWTRIVF